MMVQQSNCFIVVERGAGMQNLMQERQLAILRPAAFELQHGWRPDGERGLRPHPSVVFSENNAGGVGGAVGGLFGSKGAAWERLPAA